MKIHPKYFPVIYDQYKEYYISHIDQLFCSDAESLIQQRNFNKVLGDLGAKIKNVDFIHKPNYFKRLQIPLFIEIKNSNYDSVNSKCDLIVHIVKRLFSSGADILFRFQINTIHKGVFYIAYNNWNNTDQYQFPDYR